MTRPLGSTQAKVLRALREHGSWSYGCGWYWDTHSNTVRVLDSLVRRGDVTIERNATYPRGIYRPTERNTR